MAKSRVELQPTVEDYHTDDSSQDHVVRDHHSRSPGGQANVALKRSHPNDLRSDNSPADLKTVNIELQSDSGYSTTTLATQSTADSGPSAATHSPPTAPSSAVSIPAPDPPSAKGHPPVITQGKPTAHTSPRKPLQRQGSSANKRPGRRATVDECNDPSCTSCGPNALPPRRRRPEIPLDYPPSHRSDPAPSYTTPPSPTYGLEPPYPQGQDVVQPGRGRRRTSSAAQRPMSYHGESMPGYWQSGMPAPYPSPPQDYTTGPYNMQQQPQMHPYMMAQQAAGFYNSGYAMGPTSPPYEPPRQSARTGPSFQPPPQARSQSIYGPNSVTQESSEQPMYSARFPPKRLLPASQPMEQYNSDSYDEDEDVPMPRPVMMPQQAISPPPAMDPDRALMPPPPPMVKSKPKKRRDSLKPGTPAPEALKQRRMSTTQSQALPERPKVRDPRPPIKTAASSRAPSVGRPALVRTTQSAYDTQRATQVMVENARTQRRQSYQGADQQPVRRAKTPVVRTQKVYVENEDVAPRRPRRNSMHRGVAEIVQDPRRNAIYREVPAIVQEPRRNRDSKVYYDDDEDDAILEHHEPRRPRAGIMKMTNHDMIDDYITEPRKEPRSAMRVAEDYQERMRGTHEPLTDMIHAAARKRVSRPPGDLASYRSQDRRTQASQQTTMTHGPNGEIILSVDPNEPFKLCLNGDHEGRTFQLLPGEDGRANIVIGSSMHDGDSIYPGERGNMIVPNNRRRSIIANSARRAEEESTRSSNSSHDRRRESKPLRRRQQVVYYDD